MQIQSISSSNNQNNVSLRASGSKLYADNKTVQVYDGSALKIYDTSKEASLKTKIGVGLTTLAGIAGAMFLVFKNKGKNLEGIKEVKSIGDYFHNLTHIVYKDTDKDGKETYAVEKLVAGLAAGSVGGGLLGGILFDKKENFKAKIRESIIQMVGNIFTPLVCVSFFNRKFEKLLLPKLKLNKTGNNVAKVASSAAFLLSAIFLGNKVGNLINQKLFNIDDNRKLKVSDMSPHIDDTCLAISLVAPQNEIGAVISRFIPMALMVAGYSTGVAQERPDRALAFREAETQKRMEKYSNKAIS